MGKGDRKTKRGKITMGTFGVRRPHKKGGTGDVSPKPSKPKVEVKAETPAKPPKKTTAKKTAKKSE